LDRQNRRVCFSWFARAELRAAFIAVISNFGRSTSAHPRQRKKQNQVRSLKEGRPSNKQIEFLLDRAVQEEPHGETEVAKLPEHPSPG
jgi:hypothetical protein